MPQPSSAAAVVSPLILLRALNSSELTQTVPTAMIMAAESRNSGVERPALRNSSSAMAADAASVISRKVRSPALWRVLERSQPITAERTSESSTRSTMAPAPSPEAQGPSREAR